VEDAAWPEAVSDAALEGATTTTVLAGSEDEAIELDADSLEAAELGSTMTLVPDA